jgi:bacillithiol system protein YtxJ
MTDKLKELHTIEDLDHALSESGKQPVLFFKHSLTCAASTRAFSEFNSYLKVADPTVSYNLITVQTARNVSAEAAARLEIEHESPQAILVRNGRQVWNASHFRITASSISEAIRRIRS